jgi:hypothetical protein
LKKHTILIMNEIYSEKMLKKYSYFAYKTMLKVSDTE